MCMESKTRMLSWTTPCTATRGLVVWSLLGGAWGLFEGSWVVLAVVKSFIEIMQVLQQKDNFDSCV